VRPIRIIVPNTAGSATDGVTRIIAQRLTDNMGQQTVVDNRAGASGIIGHEITMNAVPDGYTVLVSTSAGLVINPLLVKVPYDANRDFTPISLLVVSPQMLVSNAALPARTVDELVALARAKPGQLNCASPGFGTSNHLGCEMLKTMTSVNFLHVPYKGTAPAITDLLGGHVQMMFSVIPAALPQINAGKLRAIAVTSSMRMTQLRDVPTVAESGVPGFESTLAYGILAPRGTPEAVLAQIHAQLARITATTEFRERVDFEGAVVLEGSSSDFASLIREQSEKWGKVIRAAGIKPE
jgi:tripartite-type tricarboxylate transporter receptor subunit TctC